jgi:hypothetical protein
MLYDCDIDCCLVVVKANESLVSEEAMQKFDMERLNRNKLKLRKNIRSEISNRFAALETLSHNLVIGHGRVSGRIFPTAST